MKLIDTHAHILKKYYNDDFESLINYLKKENIISFNIGFDYHSSKEVLNLYKKNKFLIPVIGFHPNNSKNWNKKKLDSIESLINSNVAAIGEIGLDYHYDGYDKKEQKKSFIDQIKLARKYNLPIVVHTRESLNDCYKIIKKYPNQKFLLHSWSGDKKITKKYLNISKNIYFSYNGIITFKNSSLQKESIKIIPLDRLMFETDSPYLSPGPYRGKINNPSRVKNVIEVISNILQIDKYELYKKHESVILDFYNIKKEQIN